MWEKPNILVKIAGYKLSLVWQNINYVFSYKLLRNKQEKVLYVGEQKNFLVYHLLLYKWKNKYFVFFMPLVCKHHCKNYLSQMLEEYALWWINAVKHLYVFKNKQLAVLYKTWVNHQCSIWLNLCFYQSRLKFKLLTLMIFKPPNSRTILNEEQQCWAQIQRKCELFMNCQDKAAILRKKIQILALHQYNTDLNVLAADRIPSLLKKMQFYNQVFLRAVR